MYSTNVLIHEDFDITTYQNENQNDFVHYMTRIIMN